MAGSSREAVRGRRVGFSTSRTHRSTGPSTATHPRHLAGARRAVAIGDAMDEPAAACSSSSPTTPTAPTTGGDGAGRAPGADRHLLARPDAVRARRLARRCSTPRWAGRADGLHIVPQVAGRPTGMLFGLSARPPVHRATPLPGAVRACPSPSGSPSCAGPRCGRAPDRGARRTADGDVPGHGRLATRCSALGRPPDYEPPTGRVGAATPPARGPRPEEVVLDWLLERRRHGAALRSAGQLRGPRPRAPSGR